MCSKQTNAWGGLFFHKFARKCGEWITCHSVSCISCYHAALDLLFPVNNPLGDESMYCKSSKEDGNRFLMTRKGELFLEPYQCEKCWFVNVCGRLPRKPSVGGRHMFDLLRRANIDIFWIWDTATVKGILGYTN